VNEGDIRERITAADIHTQVAAVDAIDDRGQLIGVAADEHAHAANVAIGLVDSRSGGTRQR
jgi:hypothetical protein